MVFSSFWIDMHVYGNPYVTTEEHVLLLLFFKELTILRYHYEKPAMYVSVYGSTYVCDHPVYDRCTLFTIGEKGLAVIQQRCVGKQTYWSEIDGWLTDALYLHPKFKKFFDERSGLVKDGLYPTVTIRQIMWALKMKPIKRERWETCFDRRAI